MHSNQKNLEFLKLTGCYSHIIGTIPFLFLKTEQLRSLNRRFKYVNENPIFSAATFLHFKFKKFEFIRNEYESIKYLNMEKEYLKKYYINSLNNNKNNNETQNF